MIEVYFVEDNIWTMDGDGELGCDIKFVRNFASGFSFEQMDILNDTVCAMEESGKVVFLEDHASVVIWYAGDKGDLMLICSKDTGASINMDTGNVWEIAGVKVRYKESLTPDGIEKMGAQWIQDGVYYFLGAMPDTSTEKELLAVAEELILSE